MSDFQDMKPTDDNTKVDYTDDSLLDKLEEEIQTGVIDQLFQKYALWVRTKMFRTQVRETIARMGEYTSVIFNKLKDICEHTEKRQSEVEKRQTSLEERYKDVLANATADSEVIDARDSETYGKFSVLDDRLENIEQLLSIYVPAGFDVEINHNLGVNPQVFVFTWLYGLGVVPLGTEPNGLFGGTAKESVPCQVVHNDSNECVVSIPFKYVTDGEIKLVEENKYLLIDYENKRSIMYELYY